MVHVRFRVRSPSARSISHPSFCTCTCRKENREREREKRKARWFRCFLVKATHPPSRNSRYLSSMNGSGRVTMRLAKTSFLYDVYRFHSLSFLASRFMFFHLGYTYNHVFVLFFILARQTYYRLCLAFVSYPFTVSSYYLKNNRKDVLRR